MVCVEAEFDGRRVDARRAPARASGSVATTHDLAAIEDLAESLGAAAAGMNMLSAAAFLTGSRPCADIPG